MIFTILTYLLNSFAKNTFLYLLVSADATSFDTSISFCSVGPFKLLLIYLSC